MAYKVYYGTLYGAVDDKDQSYAYRWNSRTLCYDSTELENDQYLMYNPILTREVNTAGSFEADIPVQNICYSQLKLMLGTVEIERDGEFIWQGRIRSIELDFNNNKHIYCEGEMAYLNDSYNEIDWENIMMINNGELMKDCFSPTLSFGYCVNERSDNGKSLTCEPVWNYDINTSDWRRLVSGLRGTYDGVNDCRYISGWDFLMDKYLNGIVGKISDCVYIKINHTVETGINSGRQCYVRKMDLAIIDPEDENNIIVGTLPHTNQSIEFGKNLTDITITYEVPDDLVTMVTAYGWETKGWWIFKNTNNLYAFSKNNSLINTYGLIEKKIYMDGTSCTQEELQSVADGIISDYDSRISVQITVKAIDLVDAGESTDRLDFLKITHIISEPHGINMNLVCTKLIEPLDDPSSKEFVYGRTKKSISGDIAQRYVRNGSSYSMSHSAKDFLSDTN